MAQYDVGINLKQGAVTSPITGLGTEQCGIVGNFERGPLNKATLVTSFTEFVRIFGSKPANSNASAWYSVRTFFAQCGSAQLYVVRVASSSALKASVTLQDRQGTPANTIKIEALSEGAWGNGLSVKILDDSILTTTIAAQVSPNATSAKLTSVSGLEVGSDIELNNDTNQERKRITQIDAANNTVYWSGGIVNTYAVGKSAKSLEFKIEVYDKSLLVETLRKLSMNDTVSFFCEKAVNGVSAYIVVTDLKTTDTAYTDLPAVTATAQPLTLGNDGLANVAGADYQGTEAGKTGIYAFDEVPNLFRFCVPDPILTDADAEAALKALYQKCLDYAHARKTVTFYADVPYSKTVAEAVTFAGGFAGPEITLWYVWLNVGTGSIPVWIPPSAAIMGLAVDKDRRRGIHKSIGHEQLSAVVSIEYPVSVGEHRTLDDGKVNCVRVYAGQGIVASNDWTLCATADREALHVSEQWAYYARTLQARLRDIVFEPHLEQTWKTVVRRVRDFFRTEVSKGAVTPTETYPEGFIIQMDSQNNPQPQVAQGIANLAIAYVPTGRMKYVVITLSPDAAGLGIVA